MNLATIIANAPEPRPTLRIWRTSAGLLARAEHTGLIWSCRVELPEGHPWLDGGHGEVEHLIGRWACVTGRPVVMRCQTPTAAGMRATAADAARTCEVFAQEATTAIARECERLYRESEYYVEGEDHVAATPQSDGGWIAQGGVYSWDAWGVGPTEAAALTALLRQMEAS